MKRGEGGSTSKFPPYEHGGRDISTPEKRAAAFGDLGLNDGSYQARLDAVRAGEKAQIDEEKKTAWAGQGVDISAVKKMPPHEQMEALFPFVEFRGDMSHSACWEVRGVLEKQPSALKDYALRHVNLTDKDRFAETSETLGRLWDFYNVMQAEELESVYSQQTSEEKRGTARSVYAVHEAYQAMLTLAHNSYFLHKIIEEDSHFPEQDIKRLEGREESGGVQSAEEQLELSERSELQVPVLDARDLTRLSPLKLPIKKLAPNVYGRVDEKTRQVFMLPPTAANLALLQEKIEEFGKWYLDECDAYDRRTKQWHPPHEHRVPITEKTPAWYRPHSRVWSGAFDDKAQEMVGSLCSTPVTLETLGRTSEKVAGSQA